MSLNGWIGVDLDGTLARYDGWKGAEHIGEPVELMVVRIRRWLQEGKRVKIFTARISHPDEKMREIIVELIHRWLEKAGLPRLEVTNVKDFGMIELWDDRAVQVIANTGRPVR